MNNREDGAVGDYLGYDQQHNYDYDTGLIALPIASRTPGFRLIRLHGGIGRRKVEWKTARHGKPPIIPTMVNGPNDTFLGGTVAPQLPVPNAAADGYDWRVSGTYDFVQTMPRIVGVDTFPVGAYPFQVLPQEKIAGTISGPNANDYTQSFDPDFYLSEYDAFWNGVASANVSLSDGLYIWPYLALPPVFSTDLTLTN